MNKEQLKERIEKSIIKIEKLEKKVTKYSKSVSQEFKWLIDEVLRTKDYSKLREYNKLKYDSHYCQGDESDYYNAKSDLESAINTYNNYVVKLKELEQYESEEKIEAIWNFLTEWKEKAYNWYIENAKLFIELKNNYDQEWEKVKEEYAYESNYISYNGQKIKRTKYNETRFRVNYYFKVSTLAKEIVGHHNNIDTAKLNDTLDKEKDRKYKDLISRVTKVIGKITDASELKIGNQDGEINGVISGELGKCSVETISAGGYNIQCFHYRVLINKIN